LAAWQQSHAHFQSGHASQMRNEILALQIPWNSSRSVTSTLHVGGQMASRFNRPVTRPTVGCPGVLACPALMALRRLVSQHILGTGAIDWQVLQCHTCGLRRPAFFSARLVRASTARAVRVRMPATCRGTATAAPPPLAANAVTRRGANGSEVSSAAPTASPQPPCVARPPAQTEWAGTAKCPPGFGGNRSDSGRLATSEEAARLACGTKGPSRPGGDAPTATHDRGAGTKSTASQADRGR